MILVTLSICVTVVVLNVHFRSSATHRMAPWVKRVFIHLLPRLLLMRRPPYTPGTDTNSAPNTHQYCDSVQYKTRTVVRTCNGTELRDFGSQTDCSAQPAPELPFAVNPNSPFKRRSSYEYSTNLENINLNQRSNQCRIHGNRVINYPSVHSNEDLVFISETHNTPLSHSNSSANLGQTQQNTQNSGPIRRIHFCPEFLKAMESVRYIADCTRRTEEENEVKEDWKYVAMVLDRLFLWIFTTAVLVGTCGIILHAPTLYDNRIPIDVKLSEVAQVLLSRNRG